MKRLISANEAEWIVPAVFLTVAQAIFVLAYIPNYIGIVPALLLLPVWMLAAVGIGCVLILHRTLQMLRAGLDRPIARWSKTIVERRRMLVFVTIGMLIAGMNMITFMWLKPLLNYLIPFWSDPYLARIDRAIFQTDPWRLLTWLNSDLTATLYHRGWFALMVLLLIKVLASEPSRDKSSTMMTYFLLWSVFGPIVHVMAPAAGPVFFQQLGYGAEFTGIPQPHETREVSEYLWRLYAGAKFGPAGGISAMPSLHIATTTWVVLATWLFARRWTLAITIVAIFICLLSVSLGWHYAIDGIVGALATVGIWFGCRRLFEIGLGRRHVRLTQVT